MADSLAETRGTNGVSFGLKYTVQAEDIAPNQSFYFDFQSSRPIVANFMITRAGVHQERSDLKVSYPADGVVLITQDSDVLEVAEDSTVQVLANTVGSLNGKYFTISSPTVDYYVWYSTDGTGVDPAIAAHTAINVDLPAGDSTADEVALATKTAIDLVTFATTTVVVDVVEVVNTVAGDATDATAGTSGFTVETVVDGVDGVDNSTFNFQTGDTIHLVAQQTRVLP